MVSMIIPCYNMPPDRLSRMMRSIGNQTYRQLQIVLVDEGSTDDTLIRMNRWKDMLRQDFSCSVYSKPNGGIASAINEGLCHSSGNYYCFPDADDELQPDYVSQLVGCLEENDGFGWAICKYDEVNQGIVLESTSFCERYLYLSAKKKFECYLANLIPHPA